VSFFALPLVFPSTEDPSWDFMVAGDEQKFGNRNETTTTTTTTTTTIDNSSAETETSSSYPPVSNGETRVVHEKRGECDSLTHLLDSLDVYSPSAQQALTGSLLRCTLHHNSPCSQPYLHEFDAQCDSFHRRLWNEFVHEMTRMRLSHPVFLCCDEGSCFSDYQTTAVVSVGAHPTKNSGCSPLCAALHRFPDRATRLLREERQQWNVRWDNNAVRSQVRHAILSVLLIHGARLPRESPAALRNEFAPAVRSVLRRICQLLGMARAFATPLLLQNDDDDKDPPAFRLPLALGGFFVYERILLEAMHETDSREWQQIHPFVSSGDTCEALPDIVTLKRNQMRRIVELAVTGRHTLVPGFGQQNVWDVVMERVRIKEVY